MQVPSGTVGRWCSWTHALVEAWEEREAGAGPTVLAKLGCTEAPLVHSFCLQAVPVLIQPQWLHSLNLNLGSKQTGLSLGPRKNGGRKTKLGHEASRMSQVGRGQPF